MVCRRSVVSAQQPLLYYLRAAASNFRDFLIFCLKGPYGELASNITFKSSADFLFWRNREKLKIPSDARWRPLETGINCAFLTCSCIKTGKCLESPLLCVVVHHFLCLYNQKHYQNLYI